MNKLNPAISSDDLFPVWLANSWHDIQYDLEHPLWSVIAQQAIRLEILAESIDADSRDRRNEIDWENLSDMERDSLELSIAAFTDFALDVSIKVCTDYELPPLSPDPMAVQAAVESGMRAGRALILGAIQ